MGLNTKTSTMEKQVDRSATSYDIILSIIPIFGLLIGGSIALRKGEKKRAGQMITVSSISAFLITWLYYQKEDPVIFVSLLVFDFFLICYGIILMRSAFYHKKRAEAVVFSQSKHEAVAGDAEAMYRLAANYETGKGVGKDQYKATEWYRRSAELGNIDAMYEYALRLRDGNGIPKDHAKAVEIFKQAATMGDEASQHRLREMVD